MWVHDNFDCSLPCSELQSSSSQWPGIQGLSAEAPAFQPYVTRHVFQWWSKVTPLRDCCGIKPPWGWPLNVWVIEALPAFPIKMCETMSREHSEGIFSSCVLAWNYGTMELWRVVLSAHHWLSCPTFWLFVGSVAIGCPPIDTSSHHPNLYHPLQVSAEWHAATALQFSRFCRPIAGQSLESSTKDDLKS